MRLLLVFQKILLIYLFQKIKDDHVQLSTEGINILTHIMYSIYGYRGKTRIQGLLLLRALKALFVKIGT